MLATPFSQMQFIFLANCGKSLLILWGLLYIKAILFVSIGQMNWILSINVYVDWISNLSYMEYIAKTLRYA